VLGDSKRAEFDQARACLDRLGQVVEARSVDQALAMVASAGSTPAVIVVAQSYPGEFSTESLDRLRRQVPLARIVGLLGSWCEGETRSGDPWPAAIRLYWHESVPQCSRELAGLVGGTGSTWSLPGTATDEERLLARSGNRFGRRHGLVALCAQRAATHDWLMTALGQRGYSTIWLRERQSVRIEGATAAIFDARASSEDEMSRLARLRDRLGPTVPIVALLDFPRVEDRDRALAAGATAVLAKPLLLDDLFWQLDQLIDES